jgi:putative photosynthetic complex assembly protein 2
MASYVLPIVVTLAAWWAGTALILWLDRRPPSTYRASMAGATIAAAAAFYGLAATRGDATVAGAYAAFACAMVIWGWIEMSFLMGLVTGPRRLPCPPGSRGFARARDAFLAIAYHELALAGALIAIALLVFGAANDVGLWTFAILWAMRLSAKLNVFLGVRNLGEELLPPHLRYLATYFRRRAMNALFPVSVIASTLVTVWLWRLAAGAHDAPFELTAWTLAASLMTLAVAEHLLLVLPMPVNAMWQWAARNEPPRSQENAARCPPGGRSQSLGAALRD